MRIWVFLVLVACSSTPPQEGPGERVPVREARSTSSPATASERSTVAQMTLDTPGLQQYFHGRRPLQVVVNRNINPAWPLKFAGEDVAWVDETSEEARIEFTLLRIEGDKAAATIRYEIEGVVMHAEFERSAGGWQLIEAEIAEE